MRTLPMMEVHSYDYGRQMVATFDYDGKHWRAEVEGRCIPKVCIVDEADDSGYFKKSICFGAKPIYRVDCTQYCGETLEGLSACVEHFLDKYDAADVPEGEPLVPLFYPSYAPRFD